MKLRYALAALPAALLFAEPALKPLELQLDCGKGYCPLLTGAPQTTGMRSGFVTLKPGESVGRHSTAGNEETLVILRGRGEAVIEGGPKLTLVAPMAAYIPPASHHNVTNTGTEPLQYVYVVAPARTR